MDLSDFPYTVGELEPRAKKDVSIHTITHEGTKALDTFLSLKETTKKCGVNFLST
jgi:hypothetical protein